MAPLKKRSRHSYSPATPPGLEIVPMAEGEHLKPIGHANLHLQQCRVSKENLLGELGTAFEDLSKPMRTLEDILMQCAIAGAMQGELDQLAAQVQITQQDKTSLEKLGLLLGLSESATKLSIMAAETLDRTGHHSDPFEFILGFRSLARDITTLLRPYLEPDRPETYRPETGKPEADSSINKDLNKYSRKEALLKDIDLMMGIGAGASQLKMARLAREYKASQTINH